GENAARQCGAALHAATTQSPLRREQWLVRRNGSEFLADVTIVALRGDDATLTGFGMEIADVTSGRAREQALRQSELHVRSILATVP
ncbi:PAS domain-containing protein, partial [Salmonella enterica]